MAEVRKHIVFHGRVQGVGFRYTAKYLANSLNLVGDIHQDLGPFAGLGILVGGIHHFRNVSLCSVTRSLLQIKPEQTVSF